MLSLAGASNTITGAMTGAGELEFFSGTTALATGATASVAHLNLRGSGARLLVRENFSYGGAFTQLAGTTVTLSAGDKLTLTGTSSIGGGINGGSTLAMVGGAATLASTGLIATTTWTSAGTALTISGAHNFTGAFTASAETITLNALFNLTAAASLTNVKLAGSNTLQLSHGATISGGLTLGGTTGVTNKLTVTQSGGDVTMGDAANGATSLANSAQGNLELHRQLRHLPRQRGGGDIHECGGAREDRRDGHKRDRGRRRQLESRGGAFGHTRPSGRGERDGEGADFRQFDDAVRFDGGQRPDGFVQGDRTRCSI